MNKHRIYAAGLVAAFVLLTAAGFAWGAASFEGYGTVSFEKIKTRGLTVSSAQNLTGSIYNSTTGKPVFIEDHLRVLGSVWRGGTRGPADNVPFIIDDKLTVTGDIKFDGGNSLGGLWDTQLDIDGLQFDIDSLLIDDVLGLLDFVTCVGELAQATANVESGDYIDCYNGYIAASPSALPAAPAEGASLKTLLETAKTELGQQLVEPLTTQ